ncbi:hypothetical protein LJC49_02915 [Ruminococcaceae bacterium OttesenSCG-928-I18]|nr:hypothetical protein [Ruminococcaceae bacterium OttesenSCG-928-I18]
MIIQHNIMSVNAHRHLGVNSTALSKKLEKLSSGYRVNVAADDAAGLAISEKMRKQITGLSRAVLNAHDGVSLVQTAEGALQELHIQLNRLEEMAVQAANGIYAADDRQKLQAETNALLEEFDRISEATNFNGIQLLDGSLSKNRGIASAAVAQAPPPYATPMALSAMSAFGAQALGLEGAGETMGIQPLGGGIGVLSTETINFETLQEGDEGTGWRFSGGVLTISGNGNNYVINGTEAETDNRIKVISGTNCDITLNNVNIKTSVGPAMDMRGATVELNITNKNTLTSTVNTYASIQTTGGSLTIDGTGSLAVQGGDGGAGIGGGYREDGGTITINSGNITARGGIYAAAIGGGDQSGGGTITINGGTITGEGRGMAAVIGGGWNGDGGTITIDGGTLTVTSASQGAGIGGGSGGNGGNIIINGGTVTATGNNSGAGIGGGGSGNGGNITITGGTVIAASTTDGDNAGGAAIGGGAIGSGGVICISGGNVTAMAGGLRGAGIGGGCAGSGGSITITGGIVTAGITISESRGAAVGGGGKQDSGDALPAGAGADFLLSGGVLIIVNGSRIGSGQNASGGDGAAAGTTTISGGNLSTVNPGNIQGGVLDGSNNAAYCVEVQGIAFGAHEAVSYTFDGVNYTAITDSNGKLYMYLPESATGGLFKITHQDTDYTLTAVVKTDHTGYIRRDSIAPVVTPGTAQRIDETTGTVEFDSSEAGTYYYIVKEADDLTHVDVDAIKTGTSGACAKDGNTLNLNGLTGNSAKTVYLVVEDGDGNVSEIQPIGLDAFVPKYNVEITLPGGVTFPADTDITVTVGGKAQTVKTDGGGKLLVPMPDGDNDIKLRHGGKNYGGVATVSGNPTSVELVEIIPPPPPPPPKGLVLQVGDTNDDYNKLTVYIEGASAAHLGLTGLSLATQESASAALYKIRDAIERVSVNRGQLGAYQNRLEHTINNLNNTVENMTAAESRIRDADMAQEMMAFTKYSVLAQAAQAMLAQANTQPQQVLQMLR